MKFIIPIPNLYLEQFILLENIWILPPHLYNKEELPFITSRTSNEVIEEIFNILNNCFYEYEKNFKEYSIAILEYPFTIEEFTNNVPLNDFYTLEKVCYEVDKSLDQIRLLKCNFLSKETLPGLPGIIKGFRYGIVANMETNQCREVLGEVCHINYLPGIGLDIDTYDIEFNEEYNILFKKERDDEVFKKCRHALRRINEAYYFNNVNTSFIYLMSTLEMLPSSEYMDFQKVRTRILPFVATSKTEYNYKCDRLKNIYQNIRTQIVHNGKSLYDIIDNSNELNELLSFLVSTIIQYCVVVVTLDICDSDTIDEERKKKYALLK